MKTHTKLKRAISIGALWTVCISLTLAGQGLLVCSSTASNAEPSHWNVRDHVPLADFVIQSHRGAGVLAPENTLGAFKLGWKLGTVPEADLRTTRDGVIVAFHDANFKRVVKGANPALRKKGVADVTFAELSKLDVGSWKGKRFVGRHVSRMSTVFSLMRGRPERRLYLDIKNVHLEQLATEVRKAEVSAQVILASTHPQVIRRWKRLIPKSQTLLWMGGTEQQLKQRIAHLRTSQFAGVTQLQIHIHLNPKRNSAEPFTLTRHFLEKVGAEARAHGILYQALPYDVLEPKIDWQLLDLGFASFATDHPRLTLRAVRDYYARNIN